MRKFIAVIAVATIASLTLSAARKGDRQPFHSNGPLDNTFVTVGGGVNAVLDNGFFNIGGPAVRADAGKWLTPYTAVRLGWQGLTNKASDTSNGWFAGEDPFAFHYAHVDWMLDATAAVLGYNSKRVVNVRPLLRAGAIITSYDARTDVELGAGPGLNISFRITPRIAVEAEADITYAREEAWRNAGKIVAFPSATAGLTVALGKATSFVRHEDTYKEVVRIEDCNHEALIAELRAEIERLRALKAKGDTVTVEKVLDTEMAVYFNSDKWDILPKEEWHLKDFVDILPEGASIAVTGHADKETGSASRNEFLSEHRAEAVLRALRSLGFTGTVTTDHKGDRENPFPAPFQKNRCVTIRVILQAAPGTSEN